MMHDSGSLHEKPSTITDTDSKAAIVSSDDDSVKQTDAIVPVQNGIR